MANNQTGSTEQQKSQDKKKGFEEGSGNNNTTAGLNKADSQKKNPAPNGKGKENPKDRSVMEDDEDVEEN